ncbi:MAG: LacI family transcriptional regulator [Acidobacteriota bacterium]|nr:LacI family transcriptional regulator [Acidobacteriota bacterium]
MSSIKDVAREAGVSTATVSHVINKTRFVSDEVRARVEQAIAECRYYPNAHARSLASGSSKILGLVISDISNPFFPELVMAIETAAYEHGYDVVLSNTNYEAERTSHYVQRFIERKVAGVALMTSEMDKSLIDELARREVSVVFLDSGEAGLHMSNLRVRYDEGIKQAILHLVELGHQDIAFIGGPPHLRSARRRLEAFRQTMQVVLPNTKEQIYQGDFKVEGGRRSAAEILIGDDLPTAVIAANDLTAFGAISEFRSAGLSIPQDISVIGFDDIDFASLTEPALTTVNLPRGELGRMAVEALMKTLSSPTQHGIELSISTHLVVRQSTSPARVKKLKKERARRIGKTKVEFV